MRVIGVYLQETIIEEFDELCPILEACFPELGTVSRSDAIRLAIVRGVDIVWEEVRQRQAAALAKSESNPTTFQES